MPYRDAAVNRAYQREWLRKRRRQWIKDNGPCEICNSFVDLEVDHINPELKIDHRVWSWSKQRREAELAKCRVLCEKCHKEVTRKLLERFEHGKQNAWRKGCRCKICNKAAKVLWKRMALRKKELAMIRDGETGITSGR